MGVGTVTPLHLQLPECSLKLSRWGSVSGFWPQTHFPISRCLTHHPVMTTTSHARPHYLPPSPSTAISNGTSEIEPRRHGFEFPAPSPASQFANPSPHYHHHLIHTTGPCFHAALYPLFQRRARIEPLRLVFRYLGPKPSTVSRLRTHHPTAAVAS